MGQTDTQTIADSDRQFCLRFVGISYDEEGSCNLHDTCFVHTGINYFKLNIKVNKVAKALQIADWQRITTLSNCRNVPTH